MLLVMRDSEADPLRRDRMAMAAAPFLHIRAAEEKPGKKEEANEKAKKATSGKFAPATAPLKLVSGR
jgi:hypothetical protein